jgi:hypothetical protein
MNREQLLKRSNLFLTLQSCLEGAGKEEEAQVVAMFLQSLLHQLGMWRIGWTELLAWDASVLQQLVTGSTSCPDIPVFL